MAQVGETLTADTSGISGVDGLSSVSYSYQWLADDAAITGATESNIPSATGTTYTLNAWDEGKTISVRVSFTDDACNTDRISGHKKGCIHGGPSERE